MKSVVRILVFLVVMIFFVSACTTGYVVNSVTTDNDSNATSSEFPQKEETPKSEPSPEQVKIAECEYQCTTNAKLCLDMGWNPDVCDVEINNCLQQCPETGKPTGVLPPPTNSYVPPVPPQPSPEMVQCQSLCEGKYKSCINKGIDPDICKPEHTQCNNDCEEQYPLQTVQAVAQVSSVLESPLLPFLDYGDAPDPTYPSEKHSNGSRHVNTQHEWLGINVSTDFHSKQMNLDEYDDGTSFYKIISMVPQCSINAVLPIIVSVSDGNDPTHPYGPNSPLYLNMLFDWNGDGQWHGETNCGGGPALEHAVINYKIDPSTWPPGMKTKTVNVPIPSTGYTTLLADFWVRATLTYNQPVPLPWDGTGELDFGETEDYGPMSGSEHRNMPSPSTSANGSPSATNEAIETSLPQQKTNPNAATEISALLSKKSEGSVCNKNNECESDICNNGVCTAFVEQTTAKPEITINTIVEALTNFFSNFFSGTNNS